MACITYILEYANIIISLSGKVNEGILAGCVEKTEAVML
jgi:hypothetical protein